MRNLGSIAVYGLLAFVGGIAAWKIISTPTSQLMTSKRYTQPPIEVTTPWTVRSIDTQVVSKHWYNVPRESIRQQVELIKSLGATYVAVATPYNRVDEMRMWVEEIHNNKMNVWFRAHWAEWEGDDKSVASLSPDEYLVKTREFILDNRDLFLEGDAFTTVVEPEQVGVGLGRKFSNWDDYRKFLLNSITVAGEAFFDIDLNGKIYTNWVSTNGWVAEHEFTQELVDSVGLVTIDHYPTQTKTIGASDNIDEMVEQFSRDLDMYYQKWKKPILLGEWGYQIHQRVDDQTQAEAVSKVLNMLKQKPYIFGFSYWTHMGNPASLMNDVGGTNLTLRPAAIVVRDHYTDGSLEVSDEDSLEGGSNP